MAELVVKCLKSLDARSGLIEQSFQLQNRTLEVRTFGFPWHGPQRSNLSDPICHLVRWRKPVTLPQCVGKAMDLRTRELDGGAIVQQDDSGGR